MGGRRRRGKKKLHLKRPKGKMNHHNPAADSSSSAPSPPWIELPRDVTANILRRLSPAERLGGAQSVCTTWRSVCDEPSLWRVIDMKCSASDDFLSEYNGDTVCRGAVDRSHGELIDINVEYFGNDDLLLYISLRSSRLKRLRLLYCRFISPQGLTTAVKSLPHLEELHLYSMRLIRAPDIETIGISCPVLKSFMLNNPSSVCRGIDNSQALTIAKNMPNLQRLHLVGNLLSNEGLQAILDGCPKLESLDLRQCFGVDLQCDLGKRCSEQIKELRRPLDLIDDDDELYDLIYDDEDDDDYDDINSLGDDMDNYSDYGDDGFYEDYDDYTNPFNDLPYPANLMWYLDH